MLSGKDAKSFASRLSHFWILVGTEFAQLGLKSLVANARQDR